MQQLHQQNLTFPNRVRSPKLSKIWFWTLEIFSCCLVAFCWVSTLLPAAVPWTPTLVFTFLFNFSSVVVFLLFLTAFFYWRIQRALAISGFVTCLIWLVWAGFPRA